MRPANQSPNWGMSVFEIQAITMHLCFGVFPLQASAYAVQRQIKANTCGTYTRLAVVGQNASTQHAPVTRWHLDLHRGLPLTPVASAQMPPARMPRMSGAWVCLRSKVCQRGGSCCVKLLVKFTYQALGEPGRETRHTLGSDTDTGVADVRMCLVCVFTIHKPERV